ncbi:peptide deformylase [Litoreibacter arenae]|uniref:Peptide deformylase n=1 Tax=Litoreibacter arenae DSM 19593 TaxID=1123360 RepID=S9QBG4_9RHOB|nr:peptide deformylase [Litoreibacter arenae]EPX76968.1 Peptide deformylase [Litoreibacter arenae DSM 19593]
MILPIVQHPDPVLRQLCQPVFDVAGLGGLIVDMFDTMYDAQGRGLAAPQVGRSERVFVMDCTWKEGERTPLAMINPEILSRSRGQQRNEEGCLSIPDHPVEVERPERIEMTWTDAQGTQRRGAFDGIEAACVLHEIDHLDGVLILDYEVPA